MSCRRPKARSDDAYALFIKRRSSAIGARASPGSTTSVWRHRRTPLARNSRWRISRLTHCTCDELRALGTCRTGLVAVTRYCVACAPMRANLIDCALEGRQSPFPECRAPTQSLADACAGGVPARAYSSRQDDQDSRGLVEPASSPAVIWAANHDRGRPYSPDARRGTALHGLVRFSGLLLLGRIGGHFLGGASGL